MTKPLPKAVHLLRVLLSTLLAGVMAYSGYGQVKFGNSYVNLSKKTVGGTVEPGDTLEIRTNIWFPNNYNSGNIYFVRYVDNIPTNTVFADDSLRLITNEGLTYKNWTMAADGDPARFNAAPPAGQYNIKINLGRTATSPANTSNDAVGAGRVYTGGTLKDKPRAGGNVLITTSFKVRVTGNYGDTIVLGAGQIRFKSTNNSTVADHADSKTATRYKILISSNAWPFLNQQDRPPCCCLSI